MVERLRRMFEWTTEWPRPRPAKVEPSVVPVEDEDRCDQCGAPPGCCPTTCANYFDPTDPECLEDERRRLWWGD